MSALIKRIEIVHSRLDGWRKQGLKETQTRMTVINPLLEALGWDVTDPNEVQSGFSAIDGKEPDYALKINGKPVLLVEAKAIPDPLTDVKAITQVCGYAANEGIAWCVLTNGVRWQVYRSLEQCPAPKKLMYVVSLDPKESEGMSLEQIAEKMWRFSREAMAAGTLDQLGEQTFTDGKVRNALDRILHNAPRPLLNLVRQEIKDSNLSPAKIKVSLSRVWGDASGTPRSVTETSIDGSKEKRRAGSKTMAARRGKRGIEQDESLHTEGRSKEIVELYRAIDRFCLSLGPSEVARKILRRYINYQRGQDIFGSVVVGKGRIWVYLKLKYNRLKSPPSFARDVSGVGHWGIGNVELAVTGLPQLEQAKDLIRQAFEANR